MIRLQPPTQFYNVCLYPPWKHGSYFGSVCLSLFYQCCFYNCCGTINMRPGDIHHRPIHGCVAMVLSQQLPRLYINILLLYYSKPVRWSIQLVKIVVAKVWASSCHLQNRPIFSLTAAACQRMIQRQQHPTTAKIVITGKINNGNFASQIHWNDYKPL